MIFYGTPAIHEPALDRADRIAAAEDRAEQVAYDAHRERA